MASIVVANATIRAVIVVTIVEAEAAPKVDWLDSGHL